MKKERKEISDSSGRRSLLGMSREELEAFVTSIGEPAYRGRQVYEWLYKKRAASFAEMTSLSQPLRQQLEENALPRSLTLLDHQESTDGTLKFLFKTLDGYNVESVLIPSEARDDQDEPKRRTLCISSQVGCPLDCKFCATATMKLKRNLVAGEIVEQHLRVEELVGERITNLVYMGMGEPMLNYDEVFSSVRIFTDPANDLVPASRITISTSGIVPSIKRMADDGERVKLAISLHVTTNGDRDRLMPINRKFDLTELMDAVEYYYRKTRRPVTYEYILFNGLNDSPEDVRRLARITRRVPSKVNVIPFHPIDFTEPTGISAELHPASPERFNYFIGMLQREGVQVMVRSSSGVDIDAACGQLAIKHEAILLADK
ncbi:MAG: 23S rRNA (adenine(2503)-C(2))-methyltransferase RlmN [Candidatus Kapaibacterium sp.]